jgi:hypothetical protein
MLLRQAIATLTLAFAAVAVSAVTLDFEEFGPAADACGGVLPAAPVTTRDFVLTPLTGSGLAVCASGATELADNAGNYLGASARLVLTHGGDLPFFLDGLDASVFSSLSQTDAILISGAPVGGGASISFETTLDPSGLAFQSINLPLAFTGVAFVSIEFVGQFDAEFEGFPLTIEDQLALDNLRLRVEATASIPEPSALLLLALALVGSTAVRTIAGPRSA